MKNKKMIIDCRRKPFVFALVALTLLLITPCFAIAPFKYNEFNKLKGYEVYGVFTVDKSMKSSENSYAYYFVISDYEGKITVKTEDINADFAEMTLLYGSSKAVLFTKRRTMTIKDKIYDVVEGKLLINGYILNIDPLLFEPVSKKIK